MRKYLLPLVIVACTVCLSAVPELPVAAERLDAVAQIDFDALHMQATTALEKLRQSHERRIALTSDAPAF
jgi:hypothetical protein